MRFNMTRRTLLKASVAGLGATMLPVKFMKGQAWAVNNSPKLQKWMVSNPLRGLTALGDPNGIPCLTGTTDPVFPNTLMYNITVGEFTDILHPQLPLGTKLWGYWETGANPLKRHLGGVIIANRGTASRLRFTNTLPTPHIIPCDITIAGANQAQNRVATHLHGGYVPWISDGGPFDWWAPGGGPPGSGSGLSFLNGPGSVLDNIPLNKMVPGQADYFYPNDQSARLMWYHDHAHGITRLNAYAGVATGYLLLDAVNAGYTAANKIPPVASTIPLVFQDKMFVDSTTTPITDPTWSLVARPDVQSTGSLWYEHVYDPRIFKLATGRNPVTGAKYQAPLPNPSCIPEFFGDTMLCNGTVYPLATVEAKRYRFMILNACNARFLNINLLEVAPGVGEVTTNPRTLLPNLLTNPVGPPIIQIGNEAGFLVQETSFPNGLFFNPATLTGNLLMAPAERADVIIDFTGKAGKEFILYNDAPGPFPVGPPTNDYFLGNPKNPVQPLAGTGPDTRNILKIKVVTATTSDPQPAGPILNAGFIDPPLLVNYALDPITGKVVVPQPPLPPPTGTGVGLRQLTLNEDFDNFGRLRQLLGTTLVQPGGGFGQEYLAPATETPTAGTVEVWQIFNTTADTHPMHFHLVNVQVLSRQPFKLVRGLLTPSGVATGPEANEIGWKETVKMHPGQVTTIVMKFDLPAVPFKVPYSSRPMGTFPGNDKQNEYVWHCHILEHEEHDMMRPVVVTGANPVTPITVTPATKTIGGAAGGTATYTITNSVGFTVVSSDNINYPAVPTATGFTVTVQPGALGATVTFTITDNTGRDAATATLVIN